MDTQRQRRNLSFLKCARCRKDRQKCTPLDRSWPSQRCGRCIKFEYPCSANLTAREQSQIFVQVPEAVGLNGSIQERTSSSGSVTSSPLNPNFPLTAESTAPKRSHFTSFLGNISNDAQPTPKCVELFSTLKEAGWSYHHQHMSAEREPESSPGYLISLGIAVTMKESTIKFYAILKDRENLIQIHQMFREGVEVSIAKGFPPKRAEKIAIALLILNISQFEKAKDKEDESATDFVLQIAHMIRAGGRWQELIDAVASPEILLVGRDHREGDGDDHENEMLSVGSLKKHFHKDHKSMDIAKITKRGDDDVFAKMKELLLMPDLQVKETCQRLSGLSQLINRLGEVEEGFGLDDDITSPTDKEPPKPKEGKDSELVSSLGSEILQRIREVLWKPDSGDESEVDNFLSKFSTLVIAEAQRQLIAESKIDGTETSINRDGSEERFESNVGEQSQDFGEDFCIQFLNSNAFS